VGMNSFSFAYHGRFLFCLQLRRIALLDTVI
jgi:hypothetical protein